MASGQARLVHKINGHRCIIRDAHGRIRWHAAWQGNPKIAGRAENVFKPNNVVNAPGARPYIAAKTDRRWTWREWECPAGEIYLSDAERAFAAQYSPIVILEPNVKARASPNKDWGWVRWNKLAWLMLHAGIRPVQLGPRGTRLLQDGRLIETNDFRRAAAVLARAKALVSTEGGLHHAAAALGVPAIVIFGGYISPRQTGYAAHVNFFTGGEPCGMRIACDHCREAMARITPEEVFERLRALLAGAK